MVVKTCFVTGAAGFLGRFVSRALNAAGYSVVGFDTVVPENAPTSSLEHYVCEQLPGGSLGPLLKDRKPHAIIHCAGRAAVVDSMEAPAADYATNVNLTFEVLDTIRQASPETRFLFFSSAAVYGNPPSLPVTEDHPVMPLSPYGFHKHLSEQICKEFSTLYDMKTASLRIFSAYGPGLRRQVVWDICRKVLCDPQVTLFGSGNESRDFVHGQDVAAAVLAVIAKAPMAGEAYNVGTAVESTIAELAKTVTSMARSPKPTVFTGEVQPGVPHRWRADITRLKSIGFEPQIALDTGVQNVLRWAQAELLAE